MRKTAILMIALATLAMPALAADRVIDSGVDLWWTKGDGGTYADFSKTPIPAGFFCFNSEPFEGRVVFRGVPIATDVAKSLGRTDTIVHRLDDAVFNKKGVAVTRIQVRAMTFESVAPVKTACGDFNVKVALHGEQPVTRMRILRENAKGGRFLATIAVNVKLTFVPAAGPVRENLELVKNIVFPPNPRAQWATTPGPGGTAHPAFVKVDTDADSIPDTFVPGTSNFAAGFSSRPTKMRAYYDDPTCHTSDSCGHCTSGDTYVVD